MVSPHDKVLYHGRDAMAFQFGRDQTHGLVAHRSNRHQQRDVHRVFDKQWGGCRRGLLNQSSGRGDRTHEGEMTPIEWANAAAFGQFARAIEREGEVGILVNAGMIERLAPALHVIPLWCWVRLETKSRSVI
jgi:hypothetical protein